VFAPADDLPVEAKGVFAGGEAELGERFAAGVALFEHLDELDAGRNGRLEVAGQRESVFSAPAALR